MRALAASIVLIVLSTAAACSGGDPPNLCDAAPTYDVEVKTLIADKCISCHSVTIVGTARNGAPEGLDFDDLESLTPNRSAFANAVTSGSEPPRDDPSNPPGTTAQERTDISEWRRCGFP